MGASGLVGRELLDILLEAPEYVTVTVFVRKTLGLKHPKLKEVLVDFEKLSCYTEFYEVEDVFCCLGTTIKKAKSREVFKRVDVDYPLAIARVTKAAKANRFLIISSLGADPGSPIFYSKMKGLVEQELKRIGFPSLYIFRPSLLLGNRNEFRFGEHVAALISSKLPFLFQGPLHKYRPIKAKTVALGMYKAAQQKTEGIFIYPSAQIADL